MVVRGKNMVDVKMENRAAVLKLLQAHGGMSRKKMAALLNLTPAAITSIVSELIKDGLVCEVGELRKTGAHRNVGRQEIMIKIDCHNFFAVGISFLLGSCVLSATDLQGELLASETVCFSPESPAKDIVDQACSALRQSIHRFQQGGKVCVGIGVSVRGIIDEMQGLCLDSYGVWKDKNVPVTALIEQNLPGYAVFMRQNVRAMAQAYLFERRNEAIESMVFIKNGTGIGAALVFNYKIYSGYRSHGSEIGHITVDRKGKHCRCGSRGCLETVSSCAAIEQSVRQIYSSEKTPILYNLTNGKLDSVDISSILTAVQYGEQPVKKIVDRGIRELAQVIRSLLSTLDIQRIVLHGSIFHYRYFEENLKKETNFDQRYPYLDDIIDITHDVQTLNDKCSPVLAIQAFYDRGGRMERNS